MMRPKQLLNREAILEKLISLQRGTISTADIHQWAEFTYPAEHEDWEIGNNGEHSVSNEVMAQLDMLDMNMVSVGDAPAFIEFLRTPLGSFDAGYSKLESYLSARPRSELDKLRTREPYAKYFQTPPNV